MLLRELTLDVLPPQAAMLSDDVILLTLADGPAAAQPWPLLEPPYGSVTVQGPLGPHRIVATRCPAERSAIVEAARGADPVELADELDAPSRRRLLGFLLGFCRTAFDLATDPAFAACCLRLARLCGSDMGAVRPAAFATSAWMVIEGVAVPPESTIYLLGPSRVRLSAAPAVPDSSGLFLVEPVEAGDHVLALSDHPLLWTVERPGERLPNVLNASHGSASLVRLREACLRALAPAGGPAAALLREMQALTPANPRRHDDPTRPLGAGLDVALPDGEGGLFLRGWLRDPLRLVAGAEIRTPAGTAAIEPNRLHRVRRPDVAERYGKAMFRDDEKRPGFVAHVPDPSGGLCAQPVLQLRLLSGNLVEVVAPLRHLPAAAARDAVLSCVPPDEVSPALLDSCLAPAAAALHRQAMAARTPADMIQIGTPVRRPTVSIIVPIYRNLDFVRFQVGGLAADPECRRAELIYVLDSPEQASTLEHLLRGLHSLHALPFRLLVMPGNFGYAAANNAAAAVARAPSLLLLNSDVVPAQPGWLAPMRAALAALGVGAVGPKLLFDDGSIQHAGLFFERDSDGVWFNAHYHKGLPRHWPGAARRRRVPGVTGAALMVRRALFETVGGLCEDYIIGDYEDSDFCLRLRAAGAAIAYVPGAELFHFERRSIELHAGYARTLASLYNRRLHHRRWDGAMASLMAQRAYRSAA